MASSQKFKNVDFVYFSKEETFPIKQTPTASVTMAKHYCLKNVKRLEIRN